MLKGVKSDLNNLYCNNCPDVKVPNVEKTISAIWFVFKVTVPLHFTFA
jgi:hypothetical protein